MRRALETRAVCGGLARRASLPHRISTSVHNKKANQGPVRLEYDPGLQRVQTEAPASYRTCHVKPGVRLPYPVTGPVCQWLQIEASAQRPQPDISNHTDLYCVRARSNTITSPSSRSDCIKPNAQVQ